jgi:transcriptional regulator with XRE-family HTH domain
MASDLQEIFKLAAKHFYKKYKKKGGSQTEIAEKLNITQSYVSAVTSGSRMASLELMEQIAAILYGPFDEFLAVGRRIQNGLDPETKEMPEPKQGVESLIAQLTHYVMDHQRIQNELTNTKEFYQDIVQNLQSGVIVTDSDDTIFFANRMMFDITNIPQEISSRQRTNSPVWNQLNFLQDIKKQKNLCILFFMRILLL